MRYKSYILFALVSGIGLFYEVCAAKDGGADINSPSVIAEIHLHNPTAWTRPLPVEIPVGTLGVPSEIDWANVRLRTDSGEDVPFSIREGRAHWKARLTAPVDGPRAEDLLVFSYAASSEEWSGIQVVSVADAAISIHSAVTESEDMITVEYPGLRVEFQLSTGMLTRIVAYGELVLDTPLSVSLKQEVEEGLVVTDSSRVRLVSQSSTAAMTELRFELKVDHKLSMVMTYRIHAAGLIELRADERPWKGISPWLDRDVKFDFSLLGDVDPLRYLDNRAPHYGFSHFADSVKHPAVIHRMTHATVLELGEETVNGRRWHRRLFVAPSDRNDYIHSLVEIADQGIVVEVIPKGFELIEDEIRIAIDEDDRNVAEAIASLLAQQSVMATIVSFEEQDDATIVLRRLIDSDAPQLDPDGYEIRLKDDGSGVEIVALNRFGFYQAALCIKESFARLHEKCIPLVANNPVVRIRGVGPGGGGFETDFCHGTEEEWRQALEQLIAGGINVICDLGMWSSWKMPVTYRGMPELRPSDPEAYDEVSGTKFEEYDLHLERGLALADYVHARGAKIWLWIPVGAVPTTYADAHPEAMSTVNSNYPCFTDPMYNRYLKVLLSEILDTYPIDGFVLIRDDNGGICTCDRCNAFVASSRTGSAVWEQYLIVYRWLRESGYNCDIAVYPYNDPYEARLEGKLPDDLLLVGHGSGAAMLMHNYETFAPMGDTWLDTVFSGFRIPTTARMKRLLADRNSFWLGGALRIHELTWRAIGRFGCEPTASVNTVRYEQGIRQFGVDCGLAYVEFARTYEHLQEIYNLDLHPYDWVELSGDWHRQVGETVRLLLSQFHQQLQQLADSVGDECGRDWFTQMRLFGTFIHYNLRRLELFSDMCALVGDRSETIESGNPLPENLRQKLLDMHREIYLLSDNYRQKGLQVSGPMMDYVIRHLSLPFKEWRAGYDRILDQRLDVKQFDGRITILTEQVEVGKPYTLRLQMRNTGVCPWMPEMGMYLGMTGEDVDELGLPARWEYEGEPMVFGDTREIKFQRVAPDQPRDLRIQVTLYAPAFPEARVIFRQDFDLLCQ